ncbi:MAG: ATP-binding protein [Kofleriaceae bacterium]
MFLNRTEELRALAKLGRAGGLAVVWGRRRIGKTRLLVEWCDREGGVYTVADQAAPDTQRAYFARAIAQVLPGFDAVAYPDWERLFARLAADAITHKFSGPIVIDELPYLVAGSPELPSVLQRWIDHDARRAHLRVAIAGSSQRMMQGLVLSHAAPLFGRSGVILDLRGMDPQHMARVFGKLSSVALIEHWAAWGGIPRYWELASERRGTARDRLVELALDPLGPLFTEPERLLLEESPPATEVRPILDAIGAGANRLSEIAGRLGRAATSMGRPLDRLIGMGLIRREVPYGEPERSGKRSLYKIDDPFLRMWFRVVAPSRAALTVGSRASRRAALDQYWTALVAQAWEDMCRAGLPYVKRAVGKLGPWRPPQRYWRGSEPDWDLVADSTDGKRVVVGDAWFHTKPATASSLNHEAARLAARPLPAAIAGQEVIRALFVPAIAADVARTHHGVHVVVLSDFVAHRDKTTAARSAR